MNPPPVPSPDADHLRVLAICHYITAGLGTNGAGEERPCPTTYVSGSRICVAGPGALRLAATAEAMSVAYHQPKGGASAIADVVTFHRSRP